MSTPTTVDEYIGRFEGEIKTRLLRMREIVKAEAPNAVEDLSYGLAAYKLNGKPLVYFGGFSAHIGLYATPNGHAAFAEEFAPYKQGKGSVQFPIDQPLPEALVQHVIQHRIAQLQ